MKSAHPLVLLAAVFLLSLTAHAANIVMMIGEDEYFTWESLPKFASEELEKRGHHVVIVHADPTEMNRFPGFTDAMKKADLVFVSVRRRTPPQADLDALRAHLDAGKPLIGLRTASHAFALRNDEKPEAGFAVWPDFDPAILGGHYSNHHGRGPKLALTAVPANASHPILKGVHINQLASTCSLYKTAPLSEDATALVTGSIPDKPSEPVAWVRRHGARRAPVFYAALGNPEDFASADFRKLLLNAVEWSLKPDAH